MSKKKVATILYIFLLFLLLDWCVGYFYTKVIMGYTGKLRKKSVVYHHDLRANFKGTDVWGKDTATYYTNSLGFRDRENREVSLKKNNRNRVLFIGDSFTEAVGVSYDSSFVGRLDHHFSARLELLNAGVVSYSPKLYYLKVQALISQGLQFDELWVMLDNPDIQDEIVYEGWHPGFWNYSTVLSIYEKLKIRYKKIITPTISWEESDYYAERERWIYDPTIYKKWGERGLQLAIEQTRLLKKLCEENNIQLHLVIFPRPEQIKRGAITDRYVAAWDTFCKEHKIDFINLYSSFIYAGDALANQQLIQECFISGDAHWNAKGHRRVADALVQKLK